jgi:signal transduction histidine kinase
MLNNLERILSLTPHPFAIYSAEGNLLFQNNVFESFDSIRIGENKMLKPDFYAMLSSHIKTNLIEEKLHFEANEKVYELVFEKDKLDNTIFVHGSYKDISSEIELKNGLEIQRNFFESILHNIPADIAVFDHHHTYLFVNKNGIKNQELREWMIGKKDEDYATLKNKSNSMVLQRRAYFNEALNTRKISSWEDELKITDSESQYILRNFYPMLNEEGNVELVIGYGIDITNRKKVEKQIISNLEKEKQLTESKSNFITTVSHEIRTPLSIISLSAEALQMYCQQLPEKLQKKFEGKLIQIEKEIERLTEIISEVNTIEKIESAAFSLAKTEFDFNEFIKPLIERQSKIQEDGRVAKLIISGKTKQVSADKIKITIALDNVLANAFKYSSNKPAPIVAVKFNSKSVQIKITDFGLGIPETHKLKLFKIFERAVNVAHIRGTGIGLFLVKQIIDLHRGNITYAPNSKGGCIFTINLPYK